jgi:SAM-dependent methyltransferase
MTAPPVVVWHDLECGSYDTDLPLWRELAAAARGPVLDIGAGTGRVALDLARLGHDVTAVDLDPELLSVLRERATSEGLRIETAAADARELALQRRFALVLVPMQTVQLLGGPAGRARFLCRLRDHLAPGGLAALALADALEGFDAEHTEPPLPDVTEIDGTVYASRPVAVRDQGDRVAIERIREMVDRAGNRTAEGDVIHLDRLDGPTLQAEASVHGLRAEPARAVPATDEHVGSTVVIVRG